MSIDVTAPRITYLARSRVPSRTANSIHVMHACEGYVEAGCFVTLTVPRWDSQEVRYEGAIHEFYGVSRDVVVRRLWTRSGDRTGGPRLTLSVLAELARQKPDLVHTRSIPMAWTASVLGRRPTVLELHMEPSQNSTIQRQLRAVQRSGRLRLIVAISKPLAEVVARQLTPGAPTVVEPDAVQQSRLVDAVVKGPRAGTETTGLVVSYAGHLYDGRGIPMILELARARPQHHFRIIGGRSEEIARLEEEALTLPNVEVIGFVPPAQVAGELVSADVLVMPYEQVVLTGGGADSSAYASPLKMFEYMASGRPIIASDVPMARQILRHEENALLVGVGDTAAWANALDRVATDRSLGSRLAQRALEDVRPHTWKARAERILDAAATKNVE